MLTVFFFVMSKCVQIDGTLDKADTKKYLFASLGLTSVKRMSVFGLASSWERIRRIHGRIISEAQL